MVLHHVFSIVRVHIDGTLSISISHEGIQEGTFAAKQTWRRWPGSKQFPIFFRPLLKWWLDNEIESLAATGIRKITILQQLNHKSIVNTSEHVVWNGGTSSARLFSFSSCFLSCLAWFRASSMDNSPFFTLFMMLSCISLLSWKHNNNTDNSVDNV